METPEQTRKQVMKAVSLSALCPGLGHLAHGRQLTGLIWFGLCQALLFGGLLLAGKSQLDYGVWLFGDRHLIFLLIPELGNFLGTQLAAHSLTSIEFGGRHPELVPWRSLGYVMSGASGILAAFCASHAAGCVLVDRNPIKGGRNLNPGTAAIASLLLPGLGHWLSGRRFKALYFSGVILGLFVLGMALGDFADFERQRHPYYWAGQMALGPFGWVVAFLSAPLRFTEVLPYQDAGLLFTTCAGLFALIAALDAYRRAEDDWMAAHSQPAISQAPADIAATSPESTQEPAAVARTATEGQ